jgi:excisionase family DNA binding protein
MREDSNKLLSVRDAAVRLGISYKTAWNWVYERKIPVTRISRCVRIPADALERMIDEHTIPARPEAQ